MLKRENDKNNNLLNSKTRKMDTIDFKSHLLNKMKPQKCKHFAYGQKYENMLLTRIRVNCSYLKAHSYKTGHSLTTACPFCPNKSESFFFNLFEPEKLSDDIGVVFCVLFIHC